MCKIVPILNNAYSQSCVVANMHYYVWTQTASWFCRSVNSQNPSGAFKILWTRVVARTDGPTEVPFYHFIDETGVPLSLLLDEIRLPPTPCWIKQSAPTKQGHPYPLLDETWYPLLPSLEWNRDTHCPCWMKHGSPYSHLDERGVPPTPVWWNTVPPNPFP